MNERGIYWFFHAGFQVTLASAIAKFNIKKELFDEKFLWFISRIEASMSTLLGIIQKQTKKIHICKFVTYRVVCRCVIYEYWVFWVRYEQESYLQLVRNFIHYQKNFICSKEKKKIILHLKIICGQKSNGI